MIILRWMQFKYKIRHSPFDEVIVNAGVKVQRIISHTCRYRESSELSTYKVIDGF